MKVPNVLHVFFFLNQKLLSGHMIDAVVAEETEKAAGCPTRNQETVLHRGGSRGVERGHFETVSCVFKILFLYGFSRV